MAYTQIIVLGNGFDLAQHIPSSYPAFFQHRYREYANSNGSISSLMQKLSRSPLSGGNCAWDYLFAFWHDTSRKLNEWKNVEDAIKDWIVGSKSIGLDDAIAYWNGDILNLNRSCAQRKLYSTLEKHISSSIPQINSSSTNQQRNDLHKELLDYFFNELHVIEDVFANYLDEMVNSNPSCEPCCYATYKNIAKAGGTEVPLEEQSNAILSFNYTMPMSLFKEPSVYYLRNVHGDLGRLQDEWKSGHEYHVVFGIDGQSCMDQPGIYQFTKTARVLSLRRQHILDDMKNRTLFDAQNTDDGIAEVKFFGHSLGEADYSYFQSLFDLIDLYGGKTKLTFCGTKMHPVNPDAVIRLMTKYGETVVPEAHGKNLLHKLLMEDRLKIEEISPL
ncbi:AbiH family protein [Bifidobacterium longum]|uniref:Bacteriophage abortive infection AbiH n=1 Tax=Bifidobacterium longum subsp. longum TaxID=1679 RepID=A0A4R0TQJ7_BIFLL|nr:AbiH family protein [Bifidobacterium longum]TCE86621.1 hypothetical protein MCC10070_0819 [Bifidobacterium longum subsp. longum]TCE93034.1 hypothetical protein MCC10073_0851 [Bifidobacterium longum subsp. longum]